MRRSAALSFIVIGLATMAALGCSDGKPKRGESINLDASAIPAVVIATPKAIGQARLSPNAASSGVDGLKGGDASMTAEAIEERLKSLKFGVQVEKKDLFVFQGHAAGQVHAVNVTGGRSTISAVKVYSEGGRNILEEVKIDLILDHVEEFKDNWTVVIGDLPSDVANLPYILQPSFGMIKDDRGLDATFITDRLSKYNIQMTLRSERPAADRPYRYVDRCYSRDGAALEDKECQAVVVEYSAYYFLEDKRGTTGRSCRGDICKLSLFIKDFKLNQDITDQLAPFAKAAFVEKFGEPEAETK